MRKKNLPTRWGNLLVLKNRRGVLKACPKELPVLSAILVLFVLMAFTDCDEREFPVTPVPPPFGYIPPADVGLLRAAGGDQTVSLQWSAPPEKNMVKIHLVNTNNNSETLLDADATSAELTGLSNLVLYRFVVKTENDKGLLSHGAAVSAMPFRRDQVNPSPVTGLIGFIINPGAALAAWQNPADPDLAQTIVYLGTDSVVVPAPVNYALIKGDIRNDMAVRAVDLSGNYSEAVLTGVSEEMISISGTDDGEYETVSLQLHPAVVIVDSYRLEWGEDHQVVIPSTSPFCEVPLAETGWLDPITVTLLSNGSDVTAYTYDHHNSLPGTIRAAFYDGVEGTVNIEGDMRNIGSLDEGETCSYQVRVNTGGLYRVTAYVARPDGTARYEIYIDGQFAATGEVGGTGGWDNFRPFTGPTFELPEGNHILKVKFLNGGANYQKFFFQKSES